ncbi:MAG: hypothetical protein ACREQV_07560 [Candidatus Binatia bacterium]
MDFLAYGVTAADIELNSECGEEDRKQLHAINNANLSVGVVGNLLGTFFPPADIAASGSEATLIAAANRIEQRCREYE